MSLFRRIVLAGVLAALVSTAARATPLFARRLDRSCSACHSVVPKLNAEGLAFAAPGYRVPQPARSTDDRSHRDTVPIATWITLRHEKRDGGPEETFLPKVELIAGGPIGQRFSYFVEWRIVSDSLEADGTFEDRGGRFEDLFVQWQIAPRHALKIGQFRSLEQVDVSLRLSPSEPLVFRNGLPTGSSGDPRVQSLMAFSPSSRSPGLSWKYRSRSGDRASDGLFHVLSIPFTGEMSFPLGDEAEQAASFELHGPKGIYAETFWRKGVRTVGGHAFLEDDNWLITGMAVWELRGRIELSGAVGLDHREDPDDERARGGVQGEYLWNRGRRWRGAAGLRLEGVSDDGLSRTVVPYAVATFPNRRYTLLVQAEYRSQPGSDVFILDFSAVF